jgi:hypothetical protein
MEHSSDPPDPWAGYKRCLTAIPECDHLLVVQDDVIPCANFAQTVNHIAQDVPVCLFMGSMPASTAALARRAMIKGQRFVSLTPASFVPLVAVLWPKQKAQEFLRWSFGTDKLTRADDGNAAKWVRRTKQKILVAVPSLVEHNDYTPSVKGGRQHFPGRESWRRALFLSQDGSEFLSG